MTLGPNERYYMKEKLLMRKEYDGESIIDLDSHVNDIINTLPKDENFFPVGTLVVEIWYKPE